MRQWFVGITRDWRKSQRALREQKFSVYVPKKYERVQEGRKFHARCTVRFSGYIFIGCEPHEVGPIKGTDGMDDSSGSVLVGGSTPYVLRPGYLSAIQAIEDEELATATAPKRPDPRNDLRPGDLVEMPNGALGYFLGSERGSASVLAGPGTWKVREDELKRVEPERKAA